MSCQCSHCRSYRADQRDGTGRFNRLIEALDPSSVKMDDRNLEDLLVFLKRYANQIRHYPTPAEDTGEVFTWKTFFEQDRAVLLASILVADTEQEEQSYLKSRERLYANPNINDFKGLFNPILGIAKQLDNWLFLAQSSSKTPLQTELELLIRSNLSGQLLKLFQYAKGVETPKQKEIELHFTPKVKDVWNHNSQEILGDSSIYYGAKQGDELDEDDEENPEMSRLVNASWYIDDVFQAFKTGMDAIIAKSRNFFESQLTESADHHPHMALLMAFLQLFKFLQNDLNELPRRHLDFFYQEVLQLKAKEAQPDQVYVLFELAKGVADYLVLPGTPVSAGNDALGAERIYTTSKETPLVINRAQVAQVKNLFLGTDGMGSLAKYFANPVANSADGLGIPFKDLNASFDTFGVGGRDEEIQLTLCNYRKQQQLFGHPARLGFAISSPQLLLGGGMRTIKLKIKTLLENFIRKHTPSTTTSLNPFDLNSLLSFSLTTEKGWEQVGAKKIETNTPVEIEIILPPAFSKVIPFDAKLHPGDDFKTSNPVLKIDFLQLEKPIYEKDLVLDHSFELTTNVIGLKDLVLQNSLQRVENDKTFPVFTMLPSIGAPFYIGSKEFFSKKVSSHSFTWDPSNNFNTTEKAWDGNNWSNVETDKRRYNLNSDEFQGKSDNAFFRLTLDSIAGTPNDTIIASIEEASRYALNKLQANSISLTYDSTLSFSDLTPGIDQFFHLYPFGILETFPTKNSAERRNMERLTDGQFVDTQVPGSDAAPNWYLLPQFFFGTRYDVNLLSGARQQYNQMVLQKGHLFIGIKDVLPLQTLSLLFQFEEGSQAEDEIPGKVHWSYLNNNAWKPLSSDRILSDTSYGLQTTGLIIFDLPADATTQHTLMPADLVWLCGTVDTEPDRFPRLINIQAQAVMLTYDDKENAPNHYRIALPPGSITQLQEKVAEVKSLKQPYPSFGGVPAQEGTDFYLAASERIRHKGRAVTIWDYEHLVLGRFPEIFKVKALPYLDPRCLCQSESKLKKCPPPTTERDCCGGPQEAPGNVLLVAIPNIQQRVGNRLQPKNSNRVLRSIEQYLRPRVTPFTTVQVKNPEYEEVLTSFRVQFKEGIDKGKFLRILNEDLVRFLTPWAFETEGTQIDIRFDQRIYSSEIINFIEERPYVDFITDFLLFHCHEDCCGKGKEQELVEVSGIIKIGAMAQGVFSEISETEKPLYPISIQLLGSDIETSIYSGQTFKLLVSEGMSLLIKAENFETRVITAFKNPSQGIEWRDYFDEQPINLSEPSGLEIVSSTSNNISITATNKLDSNLIDNITVKTLDGNIISPVGQNYPVGVNQDLIIESDGFQSKQIISRATQTIKLMPLVIPKLIIEVKDAKTPIATLEDLLITVLGNPDQRAIKDVPSGEWTIDNVKTGSQLLIQAKNYVPRLVDVTEDTLEISSASPATVTLKTELLLDQTHCFKDCDDLIEFWEEVRNTYLPGLNGAEIAVTPSNPRAILVSTEQHWIELYQAPEVIDPCQVNPAEKKTVAPGSSDPSSPKSGGTPSNPGYVGPFYPKLYYGYGKRLYIDERYRLFYERWINFQELRLMFETYNRVIGVIDPADIIKGQFDVSINRATLNILQSADFINNRTQVVRDVLNQGLPTPNINTPGDFFTINSGIGGTLFNLNQPIFPFGARPNVITDFNILRRL